MNKEYRRQYYLKNKEKAIRVAKAYYANNKEAVLEQHKVYRDKNRIELRRKARIYTVERKKDVAFKLRTNLRTRLYRAIKNQVKRGSAVSDLGCSIEQFKIYLESLFEPGMSWDNWSRTGWHIDHIIPLTKFDLSDVDQLRLACNYVNLRPMWAKYNISKGNK